MGLEIMEMVVGIQREQEFVRMLSHRSLEIRIEDIEMLHAAHREDEVDRRLEDWLRQDEDISPAILTAVKCGHPRVVLGNYDEFETIIDIDAVISSHTLHFAAAAGYDEIVRLLIRHTIKNHPEKCQQLINGRDSRHWTALHWACQNGRTEAGNRLVESYLQFTLDFPSATDVLEDKKFTTPLHLAIKPSASVENPLMGAGRSECKDRLILVDLLLDTTEMLNMKDWEGNTPLHLAVEGKNVRILELLVKQRRLIGTERNNRGKTPLGLVWDQTHSDQTKDLTSVKIIQKELRLLVDVRHDNEALMDDRARYYNAANNLLILGALLAQLTFSGILSMVALPKEFLTTACVPPSAESPDSDLSPRLASALPPSSSASCTPNSEHVKNVMAYKPFYIRAGDVYRGSNNLSFYFSMVTIMAAIRLIIWRAQDIPLESEISRLRNSIVLISLALTLSTIFVIVAFISGGLANIPVPESGWAYVLSQWTNGQSVAILKSTMLTSTMVGLTLIIPFILVPLLVDDLAILKASLLAKFDAWDRHHTKWAIGRWRPLLTLVLAILFLAVGLFIMFILIFGAGLLSDYIELPPY